MSSTIKRQRIGYVFDLYVPSGISRDQSFGYVIKAFRRHLGLSQKEFGKLLGYSYCMISAIETGRTTIPLSKLFHVAEKLKVTSDYLMYLTEAVYSDSNL